VTKLLDLGDISDKQSLLIFGGCYSNLAATQALIQWAEYHSYLPDQCICTGDIVAYCAEPIETTKLIRQWGVHCIQGNVEQSLANNIDDCGCGFESGTTCDILSKGWFPYADRLIQKSDREWFTSLPEHISFSFSGKQCLVVHGAISDVSQFMFASHSEERFQNEFALNEKADIVIAGHSGLPFTKIFDDGKNGLSKIWHNSGALGMPANDGTEAVWFSTLTTVSNEGDSKIEFKHHRLEYDAHQSSSSMQSNGLNQGYEQALIDGIWPSMDVLPKREKQQQGVSIQASCILV